MAKFLLLLLISSATFAQTATISGSVTNPNSKAVEGVYVHILNTNLATVTDRDGKFQLLVNLQEGKFTLEFRAVGFASQQKEITVGGAPTELTVQLEESSTQLDDVVVTAQKVEEEVQKVPLSISALSSTKVQQYRMWNSQDITAVVPNLYSSNPGDGRNVTSIRGITSTSYDPSVATYVDGVNQFSLDTYIAPLVDIERIEVLRGPQGTLYGRNAMGGVINIITKQPDNRTAGFGEINFGSYGQQRYSAGVRTALIKDKLFLGVAGMYDQNDGFYTNQFDNSHFDKKHSLVGNYYLRYLASPTWSLTLNVKHNSNRNNGAFPLSYDPYNNPFTVNQNATTTMVDNLFNGSFSANYTGKGFNFSSQTTYQSNWRYYEQPIDGDFTPYDAITIINNYGKDWNKVTAWTQEFKFTSPASSANLKWTGGAYLYHQNVPSKQATHFGAAAGAIVPGAVANSSMIVTATGNTTGYALFGQATYSITTQLDLIGGLRYDYEHKTQSVKGEFQMDSNPPIVVQSDTSATANFTALSPKIGLSFHPNEMNNLYTSYSKGFRTGGFTAYSGDPSQPPLFIFNPEHSNNMEVGYKGTFLDNKIRLNVAGFYIKATDVQVPTLVLPQAITVTRNAGELESKGLEAEISATPVPHFQIDYNFGYTDAQYTTLKLSQNGNEKDLNGNYQIFTPNITSMLAAQYNLNLNESQNFKLIARMEWQYLGDQYFDLANSIKQSGYSLLNTRVGLTLKNWELFFWGRNLTDVKYISYAYDFGGKHLGNPQNFGATLRVNF